VFALSAIFQSRRTPPRGYIAALRYLGAFGLFVVAILDSSPIPTFAGADILTAILAATHRNPWYEYAAVATVGSTIGAYLTFRMARRAGSAYLERKFGKRRVSGFLKYFERWGTGALILSSGVPLPSPTSAFFAAAGVLNYPVRRFVVVVGIARAVRYAAVAVIASYYGRHFIRVLRHPTQHAMWFGVLGAVVVILTAAAVLLRRAIEAT